MFNVTDGRDRNVGVDFLLLSCYFYRRTWTRVIFSITDVSHIVSLSLGHVSLLQARSVLLLYVYTRAAGVAETVVIVVWEEPLLLTAHKGLRFCKISQKAASCYREKNKTYNLKICANNLNGFTSHETKIYSKTKKKQYCILLYFVMCYDLSSSDKQLCKRKFHACAQLAYYQNVLYRFVWHPEQI